MPSTLTIDELPGRKEHSTRTFSILGLRGKLSSHPSGAGSTDTKGYHRIYHNGKNRLAHKIAWEQAYGPVPKGMQLHHIDGNKQNNDLANLALVTPMEHRRLHLNTYIMVELKWLKDCKDCGGRFPLAGL